MIHTPFSTSSNLSIIIPMHCNDPGHHGGHHGGGHHDRHHGGHHGGHNRRHWYGVQSIKSKFGVLSLIIGTRFNIDLEMGLDFVQR